MNVNPAYEAIIEDLIHHNYAIIDGFLDEANCIGLRNNLLEKTLFGSLKKAGIGNKKASENVAIRSDKIEWIEQASNDPHEQAFNQKIKDFCLYMNRTCFTGIQSSEFHYACFEKGAFYKRHIDRFSNDNSRKFSMVTYLNQDRTEADGGALMLYTDKGDLTVFPEWRRTVIFKSDLLEHEVLVSLKDRLSITGWLK